MTIIKIDFVNSGRALMGDTGEDSACTVAQIPVERMSARELIETTVRQELVLREKKLREKYRSRGVLCENQYLTGEDVERQKSSGQILHRYTGSLGIDPDRQIRKALKAFEKGEVLLVVSGRTIEDLGQELVINPRTRVTFLKSSHKPRNRSRK